MYAFTYTVCVYMYHIMYKLPVNTSCFDLDACIMTYTGILQTLEIQLKTKD